MNNMIRGKLYEDAVKAAEWADDEGRPFREFVDRVAGTGGHESLTHMVRWEKEEKDREVRNAALMENQGFTDKFGGQM